MRGGILINCGLVPIILNRFTTKVSLTVCIVATMNICVIGQGKIGLPLSVAILQNNTSNKVVGIDVNADLIDKLTNGYFTHVIEEGFESKFNECIEEKRLDFALDYSSISSAQVIVVAVPLKIDRLNIPDYKNLESAFRGIGENLSVGSLIILETTVPVGLCRNRLIPIIEQYSGLISGKDFSFVFSPERISSGSFFHDLNKYPKLIGPLDLRSGALAKEFYSSFLITPDVLQVSPELKILSSIETTEFVKLAESIYRDVNIGLANLLSHDCTQAGIDYFEVKDSANTQSFSHLHSPGIYVGGHCIPVYPHLYEASFPENPFLALIKSARNVNNQVHKSIIDTVMQATEGSKIKIETCIIMGAAYRGNVKEIFDSGVFPLSDYLNNMGIKSLVYDPLFNNAELLEYGLNPTEKTNCKSELVIINSDHSDFLNLKSTDFSPEAVIIDGRNILNPANFRPKQLFTIGIGWNK